MAARTDFDVVIIGAGISGINAAYRVQSHFPGYTYCILEARDAIGGTWDLFKYPGIRSDSDLFTFGFQWYPWAKNNPIATGESILEYVTEAASKFGIDKRIRFRHRLAHASWSSQEQQWTLSVVDEGGKSRSGSSSSSSSKSSSSPSSPPPPLLSARFIVFGTGYYDYRSPLDAHIPGIDRFAGPVVHPQFWPEDLDYAGKNVVVVGSGATAVTLVPKLAEKARLATMLQRSPTYIVKLPNRGGGSLLDLVAPRALALRLKRLRWILTARLVFLFCTSFPSAARWLLRRATARLLPDGVPLDPHFNPSYNPWEQRLCVCPDGDFYKALHTGRAAVATGTIKTVAPAGVELDSGQFLDADILVTATGLRLQLAGGATLDVDGEPVLPSAKFLWRGAMLQDVPNAVFVIGYTNASWTLGADATATALVRLLRTLEARACQSVVPRVPDPDALHEVPLLNLNSTYVQNANRIMPKAAEAGPFAPRRDYLLDEFKARHGSLEGLEWVRDPLAKG